jgi:hypothetical protein
MAWSIYKDSSRSYKDWECCYTAWYVDHDVDTNHFPNKIKFMHDGYVDVYFDGNHVTCKVEGGEWGRETERQIVGMVSRTYHGEFIEGFEKRDGKINVIMGS